MSPERERTGGPGLEEYIETRLNLLTEVIKEKGLRNDEALASFIESTKIAAAAFRSAMEAAQVAADLRYQQRFEAQSDALAAAFLSQQTAMQTAFVVAEKAVQAALAAADRAVSKAELAADKRFEALNELRQMLNDTLSKLMTRPEVQQMFQSLTEKVDAGNRRADAMEGRLNTISGGKVGSQEVKQESRANIATIIGVVLALLAIAGYWASHR